MALDTEIDVTPNFTFSTLQTGSEIVNTLINAVLVTLVIINLNSIVSKLVLSTRESTFRYDSWVRSYIFLNSDDIISIFQWLRHRSFISETSWSREDQPLHLSRLCLPLFARVIMFLATIASLVIGIPGDRPLMCTRGDYGLTVLRNIQQPPTNNLHKLGGVCREIPFKSNLGSVQSTLSFCKCTEDSPAEGEAEKALDKLNGNKLLYFRWVRSTPSEVPTGNLQIRVLQRLPEGDREIGFDWYMDIRLSDIIKIGSSETRNFRIPFPNPIDQSIRDNMTAIITSKIPSCDVAALPIEESEREEYLFYEIECDMSNKNILGNITETYFNHLTWIKYPTIQPKIPVFPTFFGRDVSVCISDVTVTRPILNMLPLAIVLICLFIVNVLISLWTNRRGNTLDEVFLFVKDALGLDVTSNPLETARNVTIPRRKYRCLHGDRQHLGYFRGVGDQEVEKFTDGEIVSFCSCSDRGEARIPELDRNV